MRIKGIRAGTCTIALSQIRFGAGAIPATQKGQCYTVGPTSQLRCWLFRNVKNGVKDENRKRTVYGMNIDNKKIVLDALHGAVFELKTTIKHHAKERIYTMPIEETVKECLGAIKMLEGDKDDATQTFYVVKTYNDKYDTGDDTWTSSRPKLARLFDDEDSAQAVANQYNPTARIVKVRIEEVGE